MIWSKQRLISKWGSAFSYLGDPKNATTANHEVPDIFTISFLTVMKRIGLMSDTHGYLDKTIFEHFADCDEIWHAGDIGGNQVAEKLEEFKIFRGVYGNIDGQDIRSLCPKEQRFECEGLDVYMIHIGGYPGRYDRHVRPIMQENPPGLFISGHSHILKVIYDKKYHCLHMNPGACGQHGFHKIRTVLKFDIEAGRPGNAQIIELGLRGR